MDIRTSSFNFPRSRDDGAQSASQTLTFPRDVLRVAVGITGYSATFEDEDHHLGRITLELNASIDPSDPTRVNVSGVFGLRDWSGEFDDPYSGNVQWSLLADLVRAPPTAPGDARADLIVTGAEVTQCIQHFRSARHLSGSNVFADNTVRLVADKPTVVRLYVDYDRNSGLPLINALGGELVVTSGATTTTLTPLAPIVARRDQSIDRGNGGHTLNFLIPENLCRAAVSLRARVFDVADATQFSAEFEQDLVFEDLPELPIMAVGIEYTGDDTTPGATPADLAAPAMTDFVDLFDFTERTYPIPGVVISSYQVMTYDDDMESDIGEGCDKIGDLKDAVADLRGDSDDIVYGLFNVGINTGSVGGCGGGGVAVGRIAAQTTAAHEVGHALGRKHAPCDNVTRCAEPKDQDGDYPLYAGFDSDSIGEYGFDPGPMTGRVLTPGTAHDFMGYSSNKWISPYTYKALMSRVPEEFGAAGAAAFLTATARANAFPLEPVPAPGALRADGEWLRRKTQQLFLRFDITRARDVNWQAAFHFESRPRPHPAQPTDFVLDQLDAKGEVLRSACLYSDSTCCGCGSQGSLWPVRIRQAVGFSLAAKTLVLYERETEIARWEVPPPPKVMVECDGNASRDRAGITLRWKSVDPGGGDALWFLVQWRDRLGTWRGVGPRTREHERVVARSLVGGLRSLQLRVLASSGIATGVGTWQGDCAPPPGGEGRPPVTVVLQGVPAAGSASVALPAVIRAAAVHRDGRSVTRPELRWYDERGGEIGRGRNLDLRTLPRGQTLLAAALLERGEGAGEGQWLVERTARDEFRLLRGTNPAKGRPEDACDDDQDGTDQE